MLNESPAWLATILRVEQRRQAEAALLAGYVNLASTAATISKEGARTWENLAAQLRRDDRSGE